MQFKVPQFIEMESKIFGPLTFKQAIYVGGSLGMSYVLFKILPILLSIPLIILVLLFGWALSFLPKQKYGKAFIDISEAAFKYIIKTRLYTWKREEVKQKPTEKEGGDVGALLSIPKISGNRLRSVSKNLEVEGGGE